MWFYEDIGLGLMMWSLLVLGLLMGKYCSGILVGSCVVFDSMVWLCD